MIAIRQTEAFKVWLERLRDIKGRAVIVRRIQRLELGSFGDSKPVGEGVKASANYVSTSVPVTACTTPGAARKS